MNGNSYIKLWGFSVNEGGIPINIHMNWFNGRTLVFFYLYFYGKRFTFRVNK